MIDKIFDFHAHSINPVSMSKMFSLNRDMVFKPHDYLLDHTETMQENLDQTIEYYDKNKITQGLISGENTDYWINQYPDRFLHSTPIRFMDDIETQVSDFEKNVSSGNTKALGEVILGYAGLRLDADVMFPFYEICEKKNIPVWLHSGINGPHAVNNMPHWRITNADPLLFESVLNSFPKLKVVFCHFGYPFTEHTIYMMSTYNSVYADTSVLNWMISKSLYHRVLKEAVETVGSDRILYGSDQMIWPQMITKSVQNTLEAPLESHDLQNIMYNSAMKLLNFDN